MLRTIRRCCFTFVSSTAIAVAALVLISSFVPVTFDWGGEQLTLIDGGAGMVYYSIGCEWRDLAHWPHMEMRWEPPWSRDFYWLRWYWLPCKGGVPFSSTRNIAYFPFYMLLPPLLIGVWLFRPRRCAKTGVCHCGYDLTGNVSGRCPECGGPADRPARVRR